MLFRSGWNATTSVKAPYAGIHHPGGSLKRLNIAEEPVELVTYSIREIAFDEYAHWKVHRWDIGATAGGSSGSPLFDANNQIIGCLTGGASTCSKPNNDYYYALSAAYEAIADSSKQLKYWLNPTTQEHPLCEGLNPYGATYTREQTLSPAEKIRIHINRENQQLEIRFDEPAELAQLSLTTPEGKTYMRLRLNPYGQSVSLSSLPTGIYILRITCNNYIYTRKLRI